MKHPDISPQPRSIMIVSQRDSFAQAIGDALPANENTTVIRQNETFRTMNGRAVSLAFDHDVVIFDADPDDQGELRAVQDLLAQRTGDTVFLAITDNDISLVQARQLRKIGIDEVLPLSIDSDGLAAVVSETLDARRAPQQIAHDAPPALGRVIPVTQARGGIGSTTVAVNLACSLAKTRRSLFRKATQNRVVIVDFDLQFGNANVFLDLEDNGGLLQLIDATDAPDDRFVGSTLQRHALGFDVLCAPGPVIPIQSLRSDLVTAMLDILQRQYDYIIVDLPRAVVDWVEPVLKRAAHLVLVTDTSVPCVRQAKRLIDLYGEDNVGLPVQVVVNRDRKPMLRSDHIREAEKLLDTRFDHWLPDNPRLARRAVDLGRPVAAMKPGSDLGKALGKLGAAITATHQNANTKNV